MPNPSSEIRYRATRTLARFHKSDAFVRCCIGPYGSGKSSACSVEAFARAQKQAPGPDGVRRTRGVIIRNTYRELEDTTRRTFEDWIPRGLEAKWHEASNSVTIRFNDVEMEILFRALDRPQDVGKLLSLEITWAWINEAKEIAKGILDVLTGRVGRYPGPLLGGCTWSGIWMDTNPPDVDHWIYNCFIEKAEEHSTWQLFRQPGGRGPNAENIENLPLNYYERMIVGKTPEWIRIHVDGEFGYVSDGKPVIPEFIESVHVDRNLRWYPTKSNVVLYGLDFGLTPAAAIGQEDSDGQIQILDEIVTEDMGAVRFAEALRRKLNSAPFAGHKSRGTGDPAGMQRSQVDERTPFDVLSASGIHADPAYTNDFLLRREAIASALTRLTMRGRPALVVHPNAKTLVKALTGGYCFKRVQVTGEERFQDQPVKNKFSHVAEALGYLMVGEGRAEEVLGAKRMVEPPKVKRSFSSVHNYRGHDDEW